MSSILEYVISVTLSKQWESFKKDLDGIQNWVTFGNFMNFCGLIIECIREVKFISIVNFLILR